MPLGLKAGLAMSEILRGIIAQNRDGAPVAIPSVCSAHPDVLAASMARARKLHRPIVIEATSNQVNQFGGYTGMKPLDFVAFVKDIAQKVDLPLKDIVLGGDHLGPQVWRSGPADEAMAKARTMVADYVRAGFTKIHLDCSEGCAGEPSQVDDELAATRAAELAKCCETAAASPKELLFVVGTEVPPPGGARTDDHGDIPATTSDAAQATLTAHRLAFEAAGISHLWSQVGGLVVQPGVEFTPMHVHPLPADRDPKLRDTLVDWPGICLEAHSTDYQEADIYPKLAELGFAFQKVGPALTFAWREAIYNLNTLRALAGWATGPDIPETMEKIMLAAPDKWRGHYHGDNAAQFLMRHFGLADRIRYYWPEEQAQTAVAQLFADLSGRHLPAPLLSQCFSPAIVERSKQLMHDHGGEAARSLAAAAVQIMLDPYFFDATSTTMEAAA